MAGANLSLAEELALIALRDHDGKPLINEMVFDAGLAGAVLAELAVSGRVDLRDDRLVVSDTSPTGVPEADDLLERMNGEAKPRKPRWWVEKTRSSALRRSILARLTSRGVVTEERRKLLGLFPVRRYPEADRGPEAAIRARLADAIRGGPFDQRTAALIALIDACGMTRRQFPDADRKRIKQMVESDWTALSVKKVIQAIQAATAASVAVLAAVSAASTGSS